MRLFTYAAVLFVVIALVLPTTVRAQYEEDEPSKLNIRLGLFRPLDAQTELISGKDWSCEELLYNSQRDEANRPTAQFELGIMESLSTDDSAIMLAANKLWWQKPTGNSFYYGAGAGVAKFRIFGERKLTATGQLFLGYNVGDSYFVEARGLIVPEYELFGAKINLTGVMLSIGTRKLF